MLIIKNALILNLSAISPTDESQFLTQLKELYGFFGIVLEVKNIPEPPVKDFVDALANSLDNYDVIITIGGIGEHLNDIVKSSLSKGLGLNLEIDNTAKEYISRNYPVKFDKSGDILSSFLEGSTVFPPKFSYTHGFGISSENQLIISLPNHASDCKEMLVNDVAAYCANFSKDNIVAISKDYKLSKTKEIQAFANKFSGSDGLIISTKIQDICKVIIAAEQTSADNLFSKLDKDLAKASPKKSNGKTKKTKGKENTTAYKIFIAAFVIVALLCIGYIVNFFMNNKEDSVLTNNSSQSSQSQQSSEIEEKLSPIISPKLEEHYNINQDTIGWVTISGTNIDYPIMQYTDNEYYKTKDINGKEDNNGTLFADYRTDLDAPSRNIVIYGKNPKDNSKLADITGYKSVDFYKEHPTLTFSTLYTESIYKVSGVMVVNGNPDQGAVYDFDKGINPDLPEEIGEIGKMIKECTFIHTDLDITEDDHIITLYTDSYEFLGAKTVVIARKLREGENTAVNTSVAKKNDNPLMPDVWYKAYGGYKPGEEPPEKPSSQPSVEPSSSQEAPPPPPPAVSSSQAATPPTLPSSSIASTSSNTTGEITKISVHPNAIRMSAGSARELEAKITPTNAKNANLTWKSDNEDVISVWQDDDYVEIEALEEGTATITVSAKNGVKTTVSITVTEEKSSSKPSSSSKDDEDYDTPSEDVMKETFTVKSNGKTVKGDAYTIVSQILENETRGQFHQEALKAHAVATYSYLKYSKARGLTPSVILRSSVSSNVKKAVSAVLGEAVYYNNQIINATYFSTGNGYTTTSKSVWGTDLPYLVSVESEYDNISPYYKATFSISKSDFADKVLYTYGIDLYDEGSPSDWIEIDSYNPGDYVNRVSLGGNSKSLGGEVSKGSYITGRNIREQLLDYSIRSTSFDVKYSGGKFVFTTYGYGHGVGMSQYGAQGLALEGYSYDEILTHYYTDTVVK